MSDDLICMESVPKKIKKIKASSAEIVVSGTKEKPYYEIKYLDLSDNESYVGFGSYSLDIVFGYLETYFEIVDENECMAQNQLTGDLISRKELLGTERLLMTDIVKNDAAARYILEQVLFDIENAPAAFDKERVIEELKRNSHNYYPSIDHYCLAQKAVRLKDAIEIVEKEGDD